MAMPLIKQILNRIVLLENKKWKLLGTIKGTNTIDLPDNFDEILVVTKANNMIFEHHLYKEFMGSEELTQITSGYAYDGERNFSQLFFTNTSIRKSGCQVVSANYNNTQVSYIYYR